MWREVGPVYIHAERCLGYRSAGELPRQLATVPRILRTYRGDSAMHYDHTTAVLAEVALAPIITRLLAEPDVATVHVRNLKPQCFLYSVTLGAPLGPPEG